MKELSIEEKAKRYDEAIKKLRSLHEDYNTVSTLIDVKEELEEIFPELKESEDERIRKELIDFVKSRLAGFPQCEKFIDWLEKQGESNMGISEATKKELENNLNNALEKETPESWNKFLDEQGEQKPANDFIEKSQGLDEVEKYILSLVPSRPLNAIKVDAKNLRFLMSKLTTEQEYIINRIMEYLEDNDCPEDWIDFLREICIAPYVKDNRPLVKIGQSYRCVYSPRYTCLSVGDIIYVNDEYTAKLIESLSDAFELLDKD